MKKGPQIFISYKREDGRELARNVFDHLTLDGYVTFFDYSSIKGEKFNTRIFDAIEKVDDFILILTEKAFEGIDDPDNWVRQEIEHAVQYNKHIILFGPVSEEYRFPELPESIKDISLINIIRLSHNYYNESIKTLEQNLTCSPRMRFQKLFKWSAAVLLLMAILTGVGYYARKHILDTPQEELEICKDDIIVELNTANYRRIPDAFPASHLNSFRYEATFENDTMELISPVCEKGFRELHNPILNIRVINNSDQRIDLNSAELMVTDWKRLSENVDCVSNKIAPSNLKLETIELYQSVSENYEINDFDRDIKKQSTDQEFYFSIDCETSCTFTARVKVFATTGKEFISRPVHIQYY